jgi:hypothetical protein
MNTDTAPTAAAPIVAVLLAITDLRPIDWFTGKRLPLTIEELAECHRCGRKHAVVWKVEVTEHGKAPHTFNVGSSCGKKMIAEGLLPDLEPASVKAARKAARTKNTDAKRAEVEKHARRVGALVAALDMPAPTCTARRIKKFAGGLDLDAWACGDIETTTAAGTCAEGMARNLADLWRRARAAELILGTPDSLIDSFADRHNFLAAAASFAAGGNPEHLIKKWR